MKFRYGCVNSSHKFGVWGLEREISCGWHKTYVWKRIAFPQRSSFRENVIWGHSFSVQGVCGGGIVGLCVGIGVGLGVGLGVGSREGGATQ